MSEQPMAYEEVPGSRTTQQAIDQPQRERIAYEELQPGDIIQEGDEWRSECGRWQQFVLTQAKPYQVRCSLRVRRPYKISTILEIGDAIARAQKAATQLQEAAMQLQDERDELKTALRECRAAHQLTMDQGLAACKERDEANAQIQRLRKTIADNADQFANHTKFLQQQRDEARAERDRLQEVVGNLYNEPTARQVQDMLRTWATELDWSAGCFDSVGRDEIDTIQKTLIAVIERIESIVNPEGGTDGE